MPFQFEHVTTESGMHYLYVHVSELVTLADGQALAAQLQPGTPHHRGYVLSWVAKGTEYTPEVRKFFPSLNELYEANAVVVTSPLARAAINVMLRLTHNTGGSVRMFTTESEAVAWLEARRSEALAR